MGINDSLCSLFTILFLLKSKRIGVAQNLPQTVVREYLRTKYSKNI